MIIQESMTMEQKLSILSDAAKYDVACTSSGVARDGKDGSIGNTAACGICHAFSADGRCISLLKILFTNECIYDCKYCINRVSNDVPRTTFTPEEVCSLTMEFYRRNYIEGLFLSSGIIKTPNYTMELIGRTLKMLRTEYHFNGYIHCKAVPGADAELIETIGWFADRMSVNLELPTADGLKLLAPHKNRKNILNPIRQIQAGIEESRENFGMMGGNKGAYWHTRRKVDQKSIAQKREEDALLHIGHKDQIRRVIESKSDKGVGFSNRILTGWEEEKDSKILTPNHRIYHSNQEISSTIESPSVISKPQGLTMWNQFGGNRGFVPAGQSTQMIVGATGETDYEIVNVTEALYQKFDLKRVFFSAFIRVNEDNALPVLPGGPPLLREHRLYQADWLLRFYGFEATELLTKERPNFNVFFDPKCNWAIGNLEQFPVEVNSADYYTLLRVPGIGPKSAGRIVKARQMSKLRFEDLKKIGVVLKRALYFITCSGKMMYPTKIEENYITNQMLQLDEKLPSYITNGGITYQQLSLFDNPQMLSNG
ncbi:MAG TPA: putative DNA modification/repair radical SAM protein [Lachnoclostridium phytofermentans]|uniref:Putative DNA modification/repair radical SAM protein n=1 Tax=Lachnoclostridium phytofermentans TaxID=66219 RepID=A0A3D2X2J5_9FIRM|nr:putative DNA modification/repair radical SAM protein [Lachnoclostridium sp.]HCL00927.1 putative DNA modification/repair radical SAM protein [Lachnoclostridium phytofermentans]